MDKYSELSKDLFEGKKFDYNEAIQGTYRIFIGVMKKMIIADKLAELVTIVTTNLDEYYGINIFICVLFYAIQLYADFSGYMDIAIGCSKILGIRIAENFDSPYFSKSIAEYWRRWHISLGAWFRDYVYYPILRGKIAEKIRRYFKNKNNKFLANNLPTVFALAILWILIGFWHGATWAFVLYGMYHGSIIIASTLLYPMYDQFKQKFPKLVKSKIYGAFQIARTFALVLLGYFLFCVGDLNITIQMFENMFKNNFDGLKIINHMSQDAMISVSIGTVILIILDILTIRKINIYEKFRKVPMLVRWPIYCIGIFFLIMFASDTAQEFLYFKF
jgi:D-alanyl-lipoteichoic acid acyltransferase DltB (MBOAT superfamily)